MLSRCTLLVLLAGARAQHEMEVPLTGREIEEMLVPSPHATSAHISSYDQCCSSGCEEGAS